MPHQQLFTETLRNKLQQWQIVPPEGLMERCWEFYSLLEETNRSMNLTAVADEEGAALRHFADSLNPLALQALQNRERVVDIGTGAGFPGMPLALFFPEKQFTLVDSMAKRTEFLRSVASRLEIKNVQIVTARAEDFARANKAVYDVAISRAVAPLSVLLEYCLPLLKKQGLFLSWKGKAIAEEAQQAKNALQVLGAGETALGKYELTEELSLFVFSALKEKGTPPQYPRKVGIPAKKPL